MTYNQKTFRDHVEKEHKQSKVSEYLREIVYGGSDGIVTTFAVVAGFAGAQSSGVAQYSIMVVLLFGLANLFADAASMGLGNILSILADKDVYKTHREKELLEIRNNREQEINETLYILQSKGYSKEDAIKMTQLYSKNEQYWTDFMMQYELELSDPEQENPISAGLSTFFSFIFFGAIPLLPYIIFGLRENTFLISIIFTLSALVLLGFVRWKVTTQTLLRSVSEIVLIGGLSAVIAYVVGTFFRT